MKVLFLTYPRIGLHIGGFQLQIENTAKGLQRLGIEVELYNPWENQIDNADICHVFSTDSSMFYHINYAKQKKKPIIISPVFSIYNDPYWKLYIKAKYASRIPGMLNDLKQLKKCLHAASHILPLHARERQILSNLFCVPKERMTIVPNGLDATFGKGTPELFKQKFGLEKFVLYVGSINPNKNLLALIKSMKELPYKLVVIGFVSAGSENYMEQCRNSAAGNVVFVGKLDHTDPLLASAYAAAKVFVLPSFSEVMPLTLYEAAQANCKLITSKTYYISEEIRQYIFSVDPNNPNELADAISKAMCESENCDLQKVVSAMPSWQKVAEQIRDVYLKATKV